MSAPEPDRRVFLNHATRALAGVIGTHVTARVGGWGPKIQAVMGLRGGDARRRVLAALRIAIVDTRGVAAGSTSSRPLTTFGMGVDLGMDEAARAATLLGGAIELVSRVSGARDAIGLIERERLSVVISAASPDETAELGDAAARHGVALLNASATDDGLRNARCARHTFHVAASDAMRTDAQRLWSAGASHPAPRADGGEVVLWDARLDRFGAAQLNARFESRFHQPMDSDAWAGWFAVKVAWEASQRAKAVDGGAVAVYLERDATQFDGQKGVPLSFRGWDHQLRQPLYVRERAQRPETPSSTGAEADRGAEPTPVPPSNTEASRTALDSLGTSEQASTCRWS